MEINTLLQLKRVQLQMMRVRGYVVPPEELPFLTNPVEDPDDINAAVTIPLEQIENNYLVRRQNYLNLRNQFIQQYKLNPKNVDPHLLTQSYYLSERDNLGRVYVFYTPPPRVIGGKRKADSDAFKKLVELLRNPQNLTIYRKLIVITEVMPASPQMTQLDELRSLNPELFLYSELLVNPNLHFLSEPVVKVAEPPPGIRKEQLPKFMDSGIIAKFHGFVSGDVIRIDRHPIVASGFDPLAGYRVVK